ncbi:MAG: hypothetical protein IJF40_02195 [Clostridia bacterium]|nr:hypothetical protein [Clostridia bacterium]
MKKTVLYSSIAAVVTTTILCALNWFFALKTGTIMGITLHGGECSVQYGFGVMVETFYPMSSYVEEALEMSPQISLHPISLIVTLLISYFLAWRVVRTVILRRSTKKK